MRVKTGFKRHRRHRRVIKDARGYRMTRHRLFRVAHEAVLHAGQYAFAGRKKRKRDFRRLWIMRINAASRQYGFSYSQFIKALKEAKIAINRKILAHLAAKEPAKFSALIKKLKQN